MEYSKLSDFEINKRVGIALGKELMPDDCQDFGLSVFPEVILRNGDIKDYCNDPADAWPIITKAKISLLSVDCIDGSSSWLAKSKVCPSRGDSNPLRAAMIVFLMMQDVKHA